MKKTHKYIIRILLVMGVITLFFYGSGNIGVSKTRIERDARKSHRIEENYEVAKSVSDTMAAMLFYHKDLDKFTYSLYLNPKGLSFGYYYRSGGSRGEIKEGICEFRYDEYGRALLSMNKEKVQRVEINNGQEIKSIDIDSEKPFSIVLPENCGIVTIYDIDNNIIPIRNTLIKD